MSQSLFAILRRRLVIVGLALTAASFAVVSFSTPTGPRCAARSSTSRSSASPPCYSGNATGKLTASLSSRHRALFDQHPKAYAYRVEDGNGGRHQRSERHAHSRRTDVGEPSGQPGQGDLRLARAARHLTTIHRVSVAGAPAYVTFASTSDPAGLTWRIFSGEIVGHVVAPILPFALLLTIINLWTIKKSLAPLATAAAAADRIRDTPGLEPLPDEGLPPRSKRSCKRRTQPSNGWVERWKPSAPSPRKCPCLRTPLAVLSAAARHAVFGERSRRDRPDIEAMIRLVNQMLAAAQADNLVVDQNNAFDLAATARDVVASMAPLAIGKGGASRRREASMCRCAATGRHRPCLAQPHRERAPPHPPGTRVVVAVDAQGQSKSVTQGGYSDNQRLLQFAFLARRQCWQRGTGLGLSIARGS